ncbi:MAG TPA: hypothetical protein PKH31_15315, partial [Candidatus Sumerlaeota bacterium]|nr:hypothetical protein [Candidatus Sumerlaeota bacterium]
MRPVAVFLGWFWVCCWGPWVAAQEGRVDFSPTSSSLQAPSFSEVAVHDPSVIRDGSTYWVFGTHLTAGKSDDLMHWTR